MTPRVGGHLAMLWFPGLVAGSFAPGSMAAQDIVPAALIAPRFVPAAAIMAALAGHVLLRQITTPRMAPALALLTGAAGALKVIFRTDTAVLTAFRIGCGAAF